MSHFIFFQRSGLVAVLRVGALWLLAIAAVLPLRAEVPLQLNHQGRLTDAQGQPVQGTVAMLVRIYDAATAGNLVFEQNVGIVAVDAGFYSFQYGDRGSQRNGTPLLASDALSGSERYLAVVINGAEQSPRERLLSVPFALVAGDTDLQQDILEEATNLTVSGNFSFGFCEIGDSVRREITIRYNGFLRSSEISLGYPPGFSGSGSLTNIRPGETRTVAVVFSPTAAQNYGGNLSVAIYPDSLGSGLHRQFSLSGTGTVPPGEMGVSGGLSFGLVPVGISATRTMQIRNSGDGPLDIIGIFYPIGFSGPDWNGTIPPGGSQSITVTFTPTAGEDFSGNVTVRTLNRVFPGTGGAPSGDRTVSASGTGVAVPAGMVGVPPIPESASGQSGEIPAFVIQPMEVTLAEWQAVRAWALQNGYHGLAAGNGTGPNHPVREVGWYDAMAWCNAKSEMEGLVPYYTLYERGLVYRFGQVVNPGDWVPGRSGSNGYRLPTKEEWEWAARGGTSEAGNLYSGGNDLDSLGWYRDNSSGGTNTVGQKNPNALGIFDMSGNVAEWCWDGWDAEERRGLIAARTYGNLLGIGGVYDAVRQFQFVRGGAWNSDSTYCRIGDGKTEISPMARVDWVGFRPVRNLTTRNLGGLQVPVVDMVRVVGGFYDTWWISEDIPEFQISRYEITWLQWNEVRNWALNNGYTDLPVGETRLLFEDDMASRVERLYALGCPVTNVSWYDVVKWCNAKSEMEGLGPVYSTGSQTVYRTGAPPDPYIDDILGTYVDETANGYRLPSEVEWEWAARASRFFNDPSLDYRYAGMNELAAVGWYDGNSPEGPKPVGLKGSNNNRNSSRLDGLTDGLFDMSGNVREWCWDADWSNLFNRSIRGGSWGDPADYCTVAYRDFYSPGFRLNNIGFRLARSSGN